MIDGVNNASEQREKKVVPKEREKRKGVVWVAAFFFFVFLVLSLSFLWRVTDCSVVFFPTIPHLLTPVQPSMDARRTANGPAHTEQEAR